MRSIEKFYSTSQIAKLIGIHPNTVRMYEEIEFIPKPQRKQNGYRVFTDLHVKQFQLARTALQIEVVEGGLRKKIVEVIKISAKGEYEKAIKQTYEFIQLVEKEITSANEAVDLTKAILHSNMTEGSIQMNRKQVADFLGITIDTLRNWEMNGLIKVKRKANQYRVYGDKEIKRLKIIHSLRVANYSLSSILRMLNVLEEHPVKDTDIKMVLNTPNEDEDIISACDRLIISLEAAKVTALEILQILYEMKKNYSNPPL